MMVEGNSSVNTNPIPGQENLFGALLSENVIGVILDHYITFYLDMDIDGSDNSFVNPDKKDSGRKPVGYKVVPGGTAANLLDHDDPSQKRGAFANNQIWITPYNHSEQWAGGLFVYQSQGEDTLAVWSERHCNLSVSREVLPDDICQRQARSDRIDSSSSWQGSSSRE
ncbi:hypothetical protein SADUNF_Sadunf03G0083200 [Salix dunnii]|uniref:Amine oxidase n=1 Tax=Salix dunnii TaxID=1413687 RepID=A0A835N0L3_9ROSI|nr:hypothetical protein SADUNF_Sadunf03G0083200 [Salix dunnii]